MSILEAAMNKLYLNILLAVLVLITSGCASEGGVNVMNPDSRYPYTLKDEDGVIISAYCFDARIIHHASNEGHTRNLTSLWWSGPHDAENRANGNGFVGAYYDNGLVEFYIGQMVAGYAQGEGEYLSGYKDDGIVEFLKAYLQGNAKIDKDNVSYYKGNFKDCEASGKGKMVFWWYRKLYSTYQGTFYKNKFNGSGILVTQDGSYEGEFSDNYRSGFGIEKDTSGKISKQGNWYMDGFVGNKSTQQAAQEKDARDVQYREKRKKESQRVNALAPTKDKHRYGDNAYSCTGMSLSNSCDETIQVTVSDNLICKGGTFTLRPHQRINIDVNCMGSANWTAIYTGE